AGGVVARPVGLGDDADALALQAQGDDLALELVAGLLEGADICHVTSPWLFEPATIAASMAISRPKAIAAAPVFRPERSGGWGRRGGGGGGDEFCGAGEGGGKRGEKKSHPRHCGTGDRGAAVLWLDQAIRGRAARGPAAISKEKDVADSARTRGQAHRAYKR